MEVAWRDVELRPGQRECIEQVFYYAWWSALHRTIEWGSMDDRSARKSITEHYEECSNWIRLYILKRQMEQLFENSDTKHKKGNT